MLNPHTGLPQVFLTIVGWKIVVAFLCLCPLNIKQGGHLPEKGHWALVCLIQRSFLHTLSIPEWLRYPGVTQGDHGQGNHQSSMSSVTKWFIILSRSLWSLNSNLCPDENVPPAKAEEPSAHLSQKAQCVSINSHHTHPAPAVLSSAVPEMRTGAGAADIWLCLYIQSLILIHEARTTGLDLPVALVCL